MKKIFCLALMVGLLGCLKITDKPKDEPQDAAFDIPTAQVQELPEPEKYQVLLPAGEGIQAIRRRPKNSDGAESKDIQVTVDGAFIKDIQVQSGESYIYELGLVHNGNFEPTATYEVTVPKDLVFDGETSLDQDTAWKGIHRIVFREGAIVTTNGHHVLIEGDRLIAKSGLIRSFTKDSVAAKGVEGASGGLLELKLKMAQGDLRIEMRGQKGGQGAQGPSTKPRTFFDNPRRPGWSDPKEIFSFCMDGCVPVGDPGGRGAPGRTGGNSGTVEIEVSQSISGRDFQLYHVLDYGEGGNGGIGGDGEPTSPVGSNIGIVKSSGPRGPEGYSGQHGDLEQVCITDARGRNCF
jgi:hypothetical protein